MIEIIARDGTETMTVDEYEARKAEENGYCESFNGKLRDELLNGEIFYTLKEAKTVIEARGRH